MTEYKAKIFINNTQMSLMLIFNSLQLERMVHNLKAGDTVKYIGEASNAEEAAHVLGVSKLKQNDQELYSYIAATFVTMATSIYELEIYRNGLLQLISEEGMEQNVKVRALELLEEGEKLYLEEDEWDAVKVLDV